MPANARRGKRRGRPGAAAAAIAVVAVTDEELALVDGGSDDVGEWGSGTVPVPGSTTLSQGRGAATARSPEPSGSARVTVDTADAGAASVRSGSAAADETRSAKTLSPAPSPTPDQTATNDGGGGSGSGSDGPAASSGTTALRAAAAAAAAVHSAAVAGSDRITELSKGVRKYVPTAATLARAKKRSADDASGHRLAAIVTTLQAACFLFSLIVLLPDDSGGLTQGHGDQPVVVRTPSQTAIAGPNSTFSPGLVNTTYDGLRLCPRPTICSESTAQVWWLALSRGTAYWMFPVLGVVFVTKLRAFNTLLSSTVVTLWIPLGDLHDMHTRVGNTIGWATFLHTLGHVVRWADREELATRLSDQVGLSGAIAAVMCIPIIVPMTLVWCRRRNRVKWETRKHLHLLAGLFGIALAFHTPNLGGLMGACVAAYGLDVLYATFWMTFRVTSSKFTRLGSGTQLTFQNPAAWAKTGGDVVRSGYVNVAVPWISKTQWHPFSLYPNPREADASAVFIMAAGDWSRALHRSIERPTTRPVWIQGPFSSPYDAALDYDNLLLVASGIGITPALSCIQLLKDDRRISLVWMCRDPSLIEFFLDTFNLGDEVDWVLIHYTGRTPMNLDHRKLTPNTIIVPSRPDLYKVLPDVIMSVEEKADLPARVVVQSMQFVDAMKDVATSLEAASGGDRAPPPVRRVRAVMRSCLAQGLTAGQLLGMFDRNEDGVLDPTELRQGFQRVGGSLLSLSEEELDVVISRIDPDGLGKVRAEKWIEFMGTMGKVTPAPWRQTQDERKAAEEALSDGDDERMASRAKSSASTRSGTGGGGGARGAGGRGRGQGKRTSAAGGGGLGKRLGLGTARNRGGAGAARGAGGAQGGRRTGEVRLGNGAVTISGPSEALATAVDMPIPVRRRKRRGSIARAASTIGRRGIASFLRNVSFLNSKQQLTRRFGSNAAMDYVHHLRPEVVDRWSILYCGGSAPVVRALNEISLDYGIALRTESFDW